MIDDTHQPLEEDYQTISLRDLARSLRRERSTIVLSLMILALVLAVALIGAYLLSPSEKIAHLAFRLEFQGAEERTYPSGIPFSTADIVAGPVLREVYETNSLERFLTFDEFSESVYVIESNDELDRLSNDYRARLADPKLSAVDRERIEREFELKMESVARNSYTLNYAADVAGVLIPDSLVREVLDDILEVWAEYSREEKGAIRYQLPVLTTNILPAADEMPIVSLDMLRSRILDVSRNLDQLREIPGVEALRTEEGYTLAELDLRLDDIIRLYIRPLVNEFRTGLYVEDRQSAIRFLESQLDHVRLRRDEAAARVGTLKEALALYTEGSRPVGMASGQASGETVMPQFGDSFLDRIVDLAGQAADRQYRQELVDEISRASLEVVPYEAEILFYEGLLEDLNSAPARAGVSEAGRPVRTIEAAREQVLDAISNANEIYDLASENLNASRLLYTKTGPVQFSIERSLSVARLALIGILLLLIGIPLILLLAIVVDRLRNLDDREAFAV